MPGFRGQPKTRPCRRSAYWCRREDNLGYFFYDRGCKVEDVRLMVDPSTRPVLRRPLVARPVWFWFGLSDRIFTKQPVNEASAEALVSWTLSTRRWVEISEGWADWRHVAKSLRLGKYYDSPWIEPVDCGWSTLTWRGGEFQSALKQVWKVLFVLPPWDFEVAAASYAMLLA